MRSTVAENAKHVCGCGNVLKTLGINVDNRYIVAFLIKLLCKCLSDFTTANDNYIHKLFLSVYGYKSALSGS